MAETVQEERWAHIRAVSVTTIASLFGILAGVVSGHLATAPDDSLGVVVFAIAVFVQLPVLRALGIRIEDFGPKDYLFVAFLTFSFWFVTWAIMLTTGAELAIL